MNRIQGYLIGVMALSLGISTQTNAFWFWGSKSEKKTSSIKNETTTAAKLNALVTQKALAKKATDGVDLLVAQKHQFREEDEVAKPFITEGKRVTLTPEAGMKVPFKVQAGDAELVFSGLLKEEYIFSKNSLFLNKHLPDEYGYFRNTVDLAWLVGWGKMKYGHNAVEAKATLRHKSNWGEDSKQSLTEGHTVKLIDSLTKSHSHKSIVPLMWLREAWIAVSLNALLNKEPVDAKNMHGLKAGMFSFSLGRGISLGDGYGTPKKFLVSYDNINNFYAPGILFTGPLVKDTLYYDAYYAKYQEKGSSPYHTMSLVNTARMDIASYWLGVGKDDELWAFQLRWKPLTNPRDGGQLEVAPYLMYNEASAKKVELPADSKSCLATFGLNGEYTFKNLRLSGEIAKNFGKEILYPIDRNQIILQRDTSTGNLQEVYSKIQASSSSTALVPVTSANATTVADNKCYTNSGHLTGSAFVNASDRYRAGYEDQYKGWMAVVDLAYMFPEQEAKVAVAYGFASGDGNPHSETVNGDYHGWIGLNELYSGKEVNSVFILDARSAKRPMTLQAREDGAKLYELTDESFADLHYVGASATWTPKKFLSRFFAVNPNVLFFFKDNRSPAYDLTNDEVSTTKIASCYLGVEWNVKSKLELMKDLMLSGIFAVFVPGSYYADIKGVKLEDDLASKLGATTSTEIARYRLSNDVGYGLNIGLEYKF